MRNCRFFAGMGACDQSGHSAATSAAGAASVQRLVPGWHVQQAAQTGEQRQATGQCEPGDWQGGRLSGRIGRCQQHGAIGQGGRLGLCRPECLQGGGEEVCAATAVAEPRLLCRALPEC